MAWLFRRLRVRHPDRTRAGRGQVARHNQRNTVRCPVAQGSLYGSRQIANPLLVSLYADATGREVLIPNEEDSVLLGTAAVAATAARVHPTLNEAARAMIKPGRLIKPAGATEPFSDRQYKRLLRIQDQQEALRKM